MYMGFVLVVFPLICGFIIIQVCMYVCMYVCLLVGIRPVMNGGQLPTNQLHDINWGASTMHLVHPN